MEHKDANVYGGPWGHLHRDLIDGGGDILARLPDHDIARRVAACVNACRGIATKELEDGLLVDLFAYCDETCQKSEIGLSLLKRIHGGS